MPPSETGDAGAPWVLPVRAARYGDGWYSSVEDANGEHLFYMSDFSQVPLVIAAINASGEAARLKEENRLLRAENKQWECPDCGFMFSALHQLEEGGYSCPLCAEMKLSGEAARLRAALADAEQRADDEIDSVNVLIAERAALRAEVGRLNVELGISESEHHNTVVELERLRADMEQLDKERDTYAAEVDRLRAENAALREANERMARVFNHLRISEGEAAAILAAPAPGKDTP